jgi:hypothetical protein
MDHIGAVQVVQLQPQSDDNGRDHMTKFVTLARFCEVKWLKFMSQHAGMLGALVMFVVRDYLTKE